MTDSPVVYFQRRTCGIFSFTISTFLNFFFLPEIFQHSGKVYQKIFAENRKMCLMIYFCKCNSVDIVGNNTVQGPIQNQWLYQSYFKMPVICLVLQDSMLLQSSKKSIIWLYICWNKQTKNHTKTPQNKRNLNSCIEAVRVQRKSDWIKLFNEIFSIIYLHTEFSLQTFQLKHQAGF